MEGPQFSTRAESQLHRSWGADVIGMTGATEAKLCREAEVCFASLALVTDYDAWHDEEAAVSVEGVVAVLRANVAGAQDIIRRLGDHVAMRRPLWLRARRGPRHHHRARCDLGRSARPPTSATWEGRSVNKSSLLVVGSVALDSVETRAGKRVEVLGGAATYFSVAASFLTPAPVRLVAVVGDDFAEEHTKLLESRHVDLAGLERVAGGRTFRWAGVYAPDFSTRTTLDTQLNVFQEFRPKLPAGWADSDYVFLANIDPVLQLGVLEQAQEAAVSSRATR